MHTLAIVCLLIIMSIVLKNLFLYLASRSLMPVKNKVSTRFRIDIFNKVLSLPIGYFTEQRKGDLMQRMICPVDAKQHRTGETAIEHQKTYDSLNGDTVKTLAIHFKG